jgi:hypothetical protein
MQLWKARPSIVAAVAVLLLSGCVSSIRTSTIDVRATIDQSGSDRAYHALALALIDHGFDLKIKDSAMRLVTTEPKKYDSVSGWPPFDFYLSITALVRDMPGSDRAELTLRPKIREQNRMNASAFTEHPLFVYSPEEAATPMGRTSRAEAMQKGYVMFRSVLQSIAAALGVSADSFRSTTERVEVSGL